jgi:hypothetical protein
LRQLWPDARNFGCVAEEQTTSYKTPWGEMMDRRNAHLDALPGKVYREWFEALNRASRVFGDNGVELNDHFQQFLGTPMFVSELPDDFGFKAARLLHNYLAAMTTFRDVQRSIHRKVWPDPYAPGTEDKRTKWEVETWTPKITELFGDEPTVFLVDLRNYSVHYAIPVMSMATNFHGGGPGGAAAMSNTVTVDRKELLKWDGWRSKGRQHITSAPNDSIDIVTPIATYSTRVPQFFAWFWEQIENSARADILEHRYKSMEFGHYLEVEQVVTQFGPDGPGAVKRPLVEARMRRAEFGTRGWRLITVDSNGETVVGERDPGWPPLPPGPR